MYVTVSNRKLVDAETDENIKVLRVAMETDHPAWEKYVYEQAEKYYNGLGDSSERKQSAN